MADQENDNHPTTVGDLIDILSDLEPDAVVILPKDAEGNYYSPFADISTGVYIAETTWNGEFHEHTDDEADDETDGVLAVALWPTN